MKDFNVDDKTKRNIIDNKCKRDEYSEFNFNIDELIPYVLSSLMQDVLNQNLKYMKKIRKLLDSSYSF